MSLAAANRVPATFSRHKPPGPEPAERFHLAFGHGAHFCACAALARVEAQEVLRRLLAVTPPIEERQLTLTRCRSAAFRRVDMLLLR